MTLQTNNLADNNSGVMLQIKPARDIPGILEDARLGLLSEPRSLPPKYFYDDVGSALFEEICNTEEYYPTRTEDTLLKENSISIISTSRPDKIIEFGSGSSRKTRRLFSACEQAGHICSYAPFDVCEPVLEQAKTELEAQFNWLSISPMLGDYHAGLDNIPALSGKNLFIFLGGTIGNFSRADAKSFVSEIVECMSVGDFFLLGADRVKDEDVLNAAYNDSAGITARFNLNVLNVLNRELDANFNTDSFRHIAFYNNEMGRIEMYLESICDQTVTINALDEIIDLGRNDRILTEHSHKFTCEELESLLTDAGLGVVKHYQPDNEYFSLLLAEK